MQFVIEQIAIAPRDPAKAKRLLERIGSGQFSEDHVCAQGKVFGKEGHNEANLSFCYGLGIQASNYADGSEAPRLEFEVLQYTDGPSWLTADNRKLPTVSHLGMHVTPDELLQWRSFFASEGIFAAQEVITNSHTNPAIAGKRTYNYVIFDTKSILGVDLKFIVRLS